LYKIYFSNSHVALLQKGLVPSRLDGGGVYDYLDRDQGVLDTWLYSRFFSLCRDLRIRLLDRRVLDHG